MSSQREGGSIEPSIRSRIDSGRHRQSHSMMYWTSCAAAQRDAK
jgi:hypothetical protein